MKKILFALLIISLAFTVGCKKKAGEETKKEQSGTTTTKTETKNVAGATDSELGFYPANSTVVGSVDLDAIKNIKSIKAILDAELPKVEKEIGISFEKATAANFYATLKGMNEDPTGAVVVKNLDMTPVSKDAKKDETVDGVKVFHMDSESGFAVIDGDSIIGTIDAIKTTIKVKKGSEKNLASSSNNAIFKETLSKLGKTVFKVAFVPSSEIEAELKKLAEEQPMFANVINNFKAASFGVGVEGETLNFYLNAKSDKDSIKALAEMLNGQVTAMGGEIENQLKALEEMIGKDGVEMLSKAFKSLKIKAEGEYVLVSFSVESKLIEKGTSMLPMLMGGGF
ncbi:hypothetical protein JXR93_14115 [bacterium]|nr:hypothetical protein [bacterium]